MQLTHEEAMRIHADAPGELARIAISERDAFTFEPRNMRGEPAPSWGGELRVCLNQNVVLHFVPAFNDEMRTIDELPQFVVMPDADREGTDEVHLYDGTGDLDPFWGVVFRVAPDHYADMVEELAEIASGFKGRCLLPDRLYAGSRFVHFATTRVLPHRLVRDEKAYDFTKLTF